VKRLNKGNVKNIVKKMWQFNHLKKAVMPKRCLIYLAIKRLYNNINFLTLSAGTIPKLEAEKENSY